MYYPRIAEKGHVQQFAFSNLKFCVRRDVHFGLTYRMRKPLLLLNSQIV